MSVADTKPEPIRVGVEGVAPRKQEPSLPVQIDWQHLIGLPPFQMFAVERSGKSPGDIDGWMRDWLQGHADPQALYDNYCQWHTAKGYWPNETPMGEVKR